MPILLTMWCSSSLSLPLLLLLLSLPPIHPLFPSHQAIKKQTPTTASSKANNHPQPNSIDPSETQTLFKIMESMSSDHPWRTSHPNPCKPGSVWPGLECKRGNDDKLHVSRLDFGCPPNPKCKDTAKFPLEIFQLPHLESVFFFDCFTHTKTTLSVSSPRLSGSSLQQLSLRSNPALVGPIPPQFSSLESLQVLTLSQNSHDGRIPVEILGLLSLVHLDLSYNFLTGTVPDQLSNLKTLEGLDLSYNSLSGSIPSTIGDLGRLQKLDLSSNSLVGAIPASVEKLSSLNFFALSNNKLRGNFPRGLFKLQNLQYFIMDDNPMFTTLPLDFGKLAKLQELRLANSGYSGSIPQTYSQLLNLTTLSLQNNRLSGEIPPGFGSLSHIYHLNLSRNMLGGVVPLSSSFLKRLGRNLDLSGNSGLCLSPSEAYGVKIGVSVCGSNRNGSVIQPLRKSGAPSFGFYKSFFVFGVSAVLGLHQSSLL